MEVYAVGLFKGIYVVVHRIKIGIEEGEYPVSSDGSLEGLNDENIEGEGSVTEDGIKQGPDGELLGITHVEAGIRKLNGYSLGK